MLVNPNAFTVYICSYLMFLPNLYPLHIRSFSPCTAALASSTRSNCTNPNPWCIDKAAKLMLLMKMYIPVGWKIPDVQKSPFNRAKLLPLTLAS